MNKHFTVQKIAAFSALMSFLLPHAALAEPESLVLPLDSRVKSIKNAIEMAKQSKAELEKKDRKLMTKIEAAAEEFADHVSEYDAPARLQAAYEDQMRSLRNFAGNSGLEYSGTRVLYPAVGPGRSRVSSVHEDFRTMMAQASGEATNSDSPFAMRKATLSKIKEALTGPFAKGDLVALGFLKDNDIVSSRPEAAVDEAIEQMADADGMTRFKSKIPALEALLRSRASPSSSSKLSLLASLDQELSPEAIEEFRSQELEIKRSMVDIAENRSAFELAQEGRLKAQKEIMSSLQTLEKLNKRASRVLERAGSVAQQNNVLARPPSPDAAPRNESSARSSSKASALKGLTALGVFGIYVDWSSLVEASEGRKELPNVPSVSISETTGSEAIALEN